MFTKLTIATAVSAALSFHAFAQQTSTDTIADAVDTPEQAVERIDVTGSRIKGVDLEGTQPLTVLDQDFIKQSGANSIYDLLRDVAQLRGGSGTFSTAQSGSLTSSTPAGQSAASLRGMGPSSTLTLVNGRRIAPSSFAAGTENFVDVNAIPLGAIERIEILATGASAVYGADAVAGVINYILKDDFEGFQLDASYGNSFAGSDEGRAQINALYGKQIGNGNLTVFADYYDRSAFRAVDRDYTRDPILKSSYSYLPKLENAPNIYYFSQEDLLELPAPYCKTPLVTTEFGEEICAYYGNQDDYLDTPFESVSAGATYTHIFNDVTWKTDLFFSQTDSTAYSTPSPINRIDDSDGPYVLENALFMFDQPDGSNFYLDQMYIDPFTSVAGREVYGFAFDARFTAPRTISVESTNYRLVSELSGDIGSWYWESGITLSRSESEQRVEAGIYNRYKFHAALTGELCNDGSIASYNGNELQCTDGAPRQFFNPFLLNDAQNDATLALTEAFPTRDGKSSVYAWNATINGDVYSWDAGVISAAFGVEVRREELSDFPSLNSRARAENDYLVDVFGFGSSVAEADRTQWGAFAEFYIPLHETFELQVAGRYDHFDDFGGTFNPKVGFTFRPLDSVVFRGSWSTSFRAPSLTQAGVELRTTTSTFDCGVNQAVADLYCMGDGTEVSVNTLELGNDALRAEESEAISVGFGWSPGQNTNLTVDYWQFDHEDVIDTNMTAVLDRALTDASLRHCNLVPTGAQGIAYEQDVCEVTDSNGLFIDEDGANLRQILDAYIAEFNPRENELFLPLSRDHIIPLENTGTQELSGIDIKFDHRFKLDYADIIVRADATHYIKYERNRPGSDTIESLAGTFLYPENIATFSVTWSADDYYVRLNANYTDSYQDDIEGLRGREIDELIDIGAISDPDATRDIDSWLTWDLSMGYDISKSLTVRANIDNITDEAPPTAYGSARGFNALNHDALGAMYRVGLTYRF
ncbi:TonB-dependent receptor [Salinimonas sp. HHU 13199]|uniref:TonB-dependent receptor n=1 Tax=Salinimonas profundi TaxID=2729140 RepID=A0ABR8LDA8_9ALTE|nr:TonB-dependent receptor [Salinimonas profundi]MBD3584296.1 TonB-dependent receptor [Salinimonas profundi]